jgi:Spy/CpxP family protein refolding chaperone
MSAVIKPWLLLGGIFVVGIVTGSALTLGISSHFLHSPHNDADMRAHWISFLVQRLNLTPDQKAKIKPIVMDATTRIQALHRDEVQQGSQIIRTANEQILAELTPDQKVQLQKLEDEREKMFQTRMRAWGPPGAGPGAPFPGSPGMFNRPGAPERMTPPAFSETPTNVPPPPPEQK